MPGIRIGRGHDCPPLTIPVQHKVGDLRGSERVSITECPNIVCGHGDYSAKLVGDGCTVRPANIGAWHHNPARTVPVLDERLLRPILVDRLYEKPNCPGVIGS